MENEKIPEANQESKEVKINPNSIGELISLGKDLPTSPDKVYRSVGTKEAIDDIEKSGIVRNKQSAGLVEKSRWGDRVFWSRGEEGKYHTVPNNGFVIEAPLSVAEERVVTKEDITAIYSKNDMQEVVDILKQKKDDKIEQIRKSQEEIIQADKMKIIEIKKSLGME